ncbi:C1 family peptidase [Winogradskyella sp. A3E31]|uniref:C1 family peptidase n=1 Tax=Winogradskyella sp. A3E31 TaxID=3349637 RepID=UPI00398A9F12
MKKIILFVILPLLSLSCAYDSDDKIKVEQHIPENYESTETTFTTQEDIVYFTGSSECTGNGIYSFDEDKVLGDLTIPSDLPEEFDLSSLLPPVGNQGRQGSCVSWAITYYLKSFQERIESGLPYSADRLMSPAYTYNQLSQGICEETALQSTLEILKQKGAVSIESFPYLDYSCNIQPTESQNIEAESNKITDYEYLSGENMVLEMKTLISNQTPIIISAFLDSEFGIVDEYGLTAYREHTVDYSVQGGCHAMLVIGYSDEFNAFKVVNSWGEDWGDDGYIWIDYLAFDNVIDSNSDFRVISTAIVAYDLEQ